MLTAVTLAIGSSAQPPKGEFKVLNKIAVGGDGGWDYLTMDSDARRLYIARANRVMVVDVDQGKLVGEVADTKGVHGVALDVKRKRGFTSNGGDSTVSIFDLETLKETARPKVGKGPDAIIFDPGSDRVFTFNATSKDATAIDAGSGTVAGTVDLGARPEFAVADGKGRVYVNLLGSEEVAVFDSKTLKVEGKWPIAPAKQPIGISMDTAKRRVFVSCRSDHMVIFDADKGKILDTVPIGKGTDASVFDAGTGLAFSSNGGDGTLTVIDEPAPGKFRVLANVPTQQGAKTMALDSKTHNILLVAASYKASPDGKKKGALEPGSFSVLVVGK
jgi:DNA-binding beta-propeller fold protein YncE